MAIMERWSVQWDKGRIVEMGWSSALELYVVEDDGTCHAYDIHGYFLKSFSLGKVSKVRPLRSLVNASVKGN
jgi:hypothetical protein